MISNEADPKNLSYKFQGMFLHNQSAVSMYVENHDLNGVNLVNELDTSPCSMRKNRAYQLKSKLIKSVNWTEPSHSWLLLERNETFSYISYFPANEVKLI